MIEVFGQTWQEVKKYAEERIEWLRARLESPLISNDETLMIRAQLKEMRLLLELPERNIPLTDPVDADLPG